MKVYKKQKYRTMVHDTPLSVSILVLFWKLNWAQPQPMAAWPLGMLLLEIPYSLPPQTQFSQLPTALQKNTRGRLSSPLCMDDPCPALFLSIDPCVPAPNSDENLLYNQSLPTPEDKKLTDLPDPLYHPRINSQGLPSCYKKQTVSLSHLPHISWESPFPLHFNSVSQPQTPKDHLHS